MDDRFDPLIDEVAKAMTSAPADERLAGRVMARLADGRTRRTWTWLFVPIAAATVLILAVIISRREQPHEAVAPRGSDIVVAPAPEPVVTRVRKPAVVRIVPIAQAPAPVLDPIEIDSIAVQPLVETNAIRLAPIAIDRIEISPMP